MKSRYILVTRHIIVGIMWNPPWLGVYPLDKGVNVVIGPLFVAFRW